MSLTILEGSTFCICDELGDVRGGLGGLLRARHALSLDAHAHDQRRAAAPALVGQGRVLLGRLLLPQPPRGRAASRMPSRSHDTASSATASRITWSSATRPRAPLSFAVELDFGTDFADIISVKQHDFALGDPLHAPELPPPAEAHFDERAGRVVLEEGDGRGGRTQVVLSRTGSGRAGVVRFPVALAPHASLGRTHRRRRLARRRGGASRARRAQVRHGAGARPRVVRRVVAPAAASLDHVGRAPSLVRPVRRRPRGAPVAGRRGPRAPARRGYALVHDRLRPRHDHHEPPDACCSGPSSRSARSRRWRRCRRGRRPHDRRRAGEDPPRAARRPGRGEVVRALLRDRRRDTAVPRAPVGGLALDGRQGARATAPRARAGAPSSGSTSTATATATASSSTSGAPRGLENQSWKDSGDSQRFRDGRFAEPPIAPAEVQGYVFDAKRAAGRGRPPRLGRRGAGGPARARRPTSSPRASTRPSGSPTAAGTTRSRSIGDKRQVDCALLEHRAPALERDRARRRGSSRSSTR